MSDTLILSQTNIDNYLKDRRWVIVSHAATTLIGVVTHAEAQGVSGLSEIVDKPLNEDEFTVEDLDLSRGQVLHLCPYFQVIEQLGVVPGPQGKPTLQKNTTLLPWGMTVDVWASRVSIKAETLRRVRIDFSDVDRASYFKMLRDAFDSLINERAERAGISLVGR